MSNEPVSVLVGLSEHDLNRPLIDGVVRPDGFDLTVRADLEDGERHVRMLRDGAFDACELSLANYVARRAKGSNLTAIPVFPNRKFRHSYVFCNTRAAIQQPKDLAGKRIGLRGWAATASVWVRGILAHHYDLDLARVTWFAPPDPVELTLPPGIVLNRLPAEADLDKMLVDGELDAVIWPDPMPSFLRGAPEVTRLFPDYKNAEQEFFRRTGIFPISHLLVVKEEVLRERDWLAVELLRTFRRARDECFRRLEDMHVISLSWAVAALDEQRALMGRDYWPYNVRDNRKPLEALISYAFEQGIIPRRLAVEELFVPATIDEPGA